MLWTSYRLVLYHLPEHQHIRSEKCGRFLTLQEAADHLRVSPHTIRAWVYEKRIMPTRMGRLMMFSEEEIERVIARGEDEGLKQQYKVPA